MLSLVPRPGYFLLKACGEAPSSSKQSDPYEYPGLVRDYGMLEFARR